MYYVGLLVLVCCVWNQIRVLAKAMTCVEPMVNLMHCCIKWGGGGGGGVSKKGVFKKIAGSGTLCQLWSFIEQVVPSNNLLEERGLSQTFLLNSAKQRCIQNPAQHLRRRTSECKPAKVLNLPYYMESTRIFQTVFFFYDFFFSDTQNEVWCCEEF